MTTVLRHWCYRYQWLYDSITRLSALAVGGEQRFRKLALQSLTIPEHSSILDLCCGWGQATQRLCHYSQDVVGLDASPRALKLAVHNVSEAQFVQAQADALPFPEHTFDLVHTSVALHELDSVKLQQTLTEVYRVLKPGGSFALLDLHKPTTPLLTPAVAAFIWLFETEAAWQLIHTDLVALLTDIGFQRCDRSLHGGGSLQVIHAYKAA